jgi:hypothetical protein
MRERGYLKLLDLNGRKLKWIFKKLYGGTDWKDLAQDRDR